MFGELILIEAPEFQNIIGEQDPSQDRVSSTWKSLNEFHFESLYEILLKSSSNNMPNAELKVLTSESGDVWVIRLPFALVNLIKERADKDNESIVREWSSTDEFKWLFKEDDVRKLLEDLVELSIQAVKLNKELIYWGRL